MQNTSTKSSRPHDDLFPSKRDTWLVVLLWVSVFGMFAGVVPILWSDSSVLFKLGMIAIMLVANALTLWILYGTFYVLEDQYLQVRSGPVRMMIPLTEIESVTPTRNLLSSPACSLDRLKITYGDTAQVMISPRDKQRFLERLVDACPQLGEHSVA